MKATQKSQHGDVFILKRKFVDLVLNLNKILLLAKRLINNKT